VAPAPVRSGLLELARALPGVSLGGPAVGASSLELSGELARGQPEAFLAGREFARVREDGSTHVVLAPGWGQKVLDRGWATVHPLARYLAGAVPPGSLIVYAPRDGRDLRAVWRIVRAAHAFAVGRVDDVPLPDTRW
jgi:hypothetical protein